MNKYLPWLALKNISGIGNILNKRLIENFGSPENIFKASKDELEKIKGISLNIIKNIKILNSFKKAEKDLKIIQNNGFKIVTINESLYPALLKEIPDPPPFLIYIGTLDNTYPCISIVGSRKSTSYGLNTAVKLSYDLALSGFQIVSGMALGIDTAAHKGAIKAKKRTIAILGSGLCKIYPRQNKKLFYEIADNGAVMSEFMVNIEPEARNFPIRNRIISGMTLGTVVVEAAKKSGSLITARLAAEYCREVFAVPGSIDSFKSTGTHALLKQGAKLVENHIDVIEELHHMVHTEKIQEPVNKKISALEKLNSEKSNTDKYHIAVFDILDSYPLHIDTIIEKSGLDTGGISACLLELELKGIVKQEQGKMFYMIKKNM